ncbi:MAG: hypothetical protein PHI63_05080 [Patescibacteria group bacterium]|nr:hypothetical protein [Patescibacteria group bacterium]
MKIKYLCAIFSLALIGAGCQTRPIVQSNVNQQVTPSLNTNNDTSGGNFVIYKKESGWGPCAPTDEPCTETRTLWTSGLLTISGQRSAQFHLTPQQVSQVAAAIQSSGIFQKECPASMVLDYSATYSLSDGSREKEIQFPGCEDDVRPIETLINGFIDDESLPPTKGGA